MRRVYFLAAANGLVKIGISGNVEKRLRDIGRESPIAVTLIASVPVASIQIEKRLHYRFQRQWHHGEWFVRDAAIDWLLLAVTQGSIPAWALAQTPPCGWRLPHQKARGPRDKSVEAMRRHTAPARAANARYAAEGRA